MSAPQIREVQMLRRQALWFREFARLGNAGERNKLEAVAAMAEQQAQEAWKKFADTLH